MSLKDQLLAEIKQEKGWVHSGVLERRQWTNKKTGVPYKPGTVGRCLRLLEEEASIAVRYNPCAEYRFIEPKDRVKYMPISQRKEGQEDALWKGQEEVKDVIVPMMSPERTVRKVREEEVEDYKSKGYVRL